MASEENIEKLYRVAQVGSTEPIEYEGFRKDLLKSIDNDLDIDQVLIMMLRVVEHQPLGTFKNGVFHFSTDIIKKATNLVIEDNIKIINSLETSNEATTAVPVQEQITDKIDLSKEDLNKMISNWWTLGTKDKIDILGNIDKLDPKVQQVVVTTVIDETKAAINSSTTMSDKEKAEKTEELEKIRKNINIFLKKNELIEKFNDPKLSFDDKASVVAELLECRRRELVSRYRSSSKSNFT